MTCKFEHPLLLKISHFGLFVVLFSPFGHFERVRTRYGGSCSWTRDRFLVPVPASADNWAPIWIFITRVYPNICHIIGGSEQRAPKRFLDQDPYRKRREFCATAVALATDRTSFFVLFGRRQRYILRTRTNFSTYPPRIVVYFFL